MTDLERNVFFVSWCIEEYAALSELKASVVANTFAQKNIIAFLEKH